MSVPIYPGGGGGNLTIGSLNLGTTAGILAADGSGNVYVASVGTGLSLNNGVLSESTANVVAGTPISLTATASDFIWRGTGTRTTSAAAFTIPILTITSSTPLSGSLNFSVVIPYTITSGSVAGSISADFVLSFVNNGTQGFTGVSLGARTVLVTGTQTVTATVTSGSGANGTTLTVNAVFTRSANVASTVGPVTSRGYYVTSL